ncbi:MAG: transposase, partial [Gammaproteobacteria bacterium]
MRDKDLYAQILGIKSPWRVTEVELEVSQGTVTVHVGRDKKVAVCCPQCA